MSGRMRKRGPAQRKDMYKTFPALKGFHAPQKDNSKRQKRKNKDPKEDHDGRNTSSV